MGYRIVQIDRKTGDRVAVAFYTDEATANDACTKATHDFNYRYGVEKDTPKLEYEP